MEIVIRKTDLLRELSLVQNIVERKNSIPILANVLLESAGDQVQFLVTDLEVALRSRCAATVVKPGALTLPAKKLYAIVKSLPDTDIRIVEQKSGVKITADQFDAKLPTMPREDFPTFAVTPDALGVRLPAGLLTDMIARTTFAVTATDQRYYLNGAQLIVTPTASILVATDGHRLALVTAPRTGDGPPTTAILPKKTLSELARLLSDTEGDVCYTRGENHLFFQVGDRLLISRTIDGTFPAYERILPKGNDKRLEFDRERLTNAVKRVALVSSERSGAVKFQIAPGRVTVTSSSVEFGEAAETIPVDYSGAELTTCFNGQYVLDFLAVVGTETVALELKDEVGQASMAPVGAEGYDYTYVLMPMRV